MVELILNLAIYNTSFFPSTMGKISLEKRLRVVELLKTKSQREIVEDLQISRGAVRGIVRKYQQTNSVQDRRKSDRPSKLDIWDRRALVRTSKVNPKFTARQVLHESAITTPVSTDTVKRVLRDSGLKGCIAIKKPALSKRHIKNRITWAKQHSTWEDEAWRKVVFSDESKIELHPNRREYVR